MPATSAGMTISSNSRRCDRARSCLLPSGYSPATETCVRAPMPIARAAAGVRSMTRPRTNGPLSLMVTRTDLPLLRLVTRAREPHGNDLCAAVSAFSLSDPPQATCAAVLGGHAFLGPGGAHERSNRRCNPNDHPKHVTNPVRWKKVLSARPLR